jgi:hypothetical protein
MESDNWRDLSVQERMHTRGIGLEGTHWIHLAQDRESWLALAYTDINFLIQ